MGLVNPMPLSQSQQTKMDALGITGGDGAKGEP